MGVRETIADIDPEVLFADGFDGCIIGYTDSWSGPSRPVRVVYSVEKIVDQLMTEDGLSYDDAMEHFEFNIIGAYVGEHTPVFVRSIEE
jgi:hypothetical protein